MRARIVRIPIQSSRENLYIFCTAGEDVLGGKFSRFAELPPCGLPPFFAAKSSVARDQRMLVGWELSGLAFIGDWRGVVARDYVQCLRVHSEANVLGGDVQDSLC